MTCDEKGADITVTPAPLSLKVEVVSPTVMMRVYFSSYHLWAAERFARRAADLENGSGEKPRFDIEHRAYVTGAILSAVAFLEAAINELFKDVVDGHQNYAAGVAPEPRELIKAFWDLAEEQNRSPFSILDKYQIVLTFCRKDQFQTGAQPYQDADLATRLRNERRSRGRVARARGLALRRRGGLSGLGSSRLTPLARRNAVRLWRRGSSAKEGARLVRAGRRRVSAYNDGSGYVPYPPDVNGGEGRE